MVHLNAVASMLRYCHSVSFGANCIFRANSLFFYIDSYLLCKMMGPLVISMVNFLAETGVVGQVLETGEDQDHPEVGAVVMMLMVMMVYLGVVAEVPELKVAGVAPQETMIMIGL